MDSAQSRPPTDASAVNQDRVSEVPERTLLHVAWLAIALGLGVELLAVAVADLAGPASGIRIVVADLVQNAVWSFIVCLGLAFGQVLKRPVAVGPGTLSGLLSAPLAFIAAKSAHKGIASALAVAGAAGPNPWLLALIKAAEYGCLGWLLVRLRRSESARWTAYLLTGLAVAIVFAPTLLLATIATSAPRPGDIALVSKGLNELVFPVGCALVLYVSEIWAKRLER